MQLFKNDFRPVNDISFHQPGLLDTAVPFPSEWDELTQAELLCYSEHLLSGKYTTKAALRSAVFLDILRLRASIVPKPLPSDWTNYLNSETVVETAEQAVAFLFEDNFLTTQLFPELQLPGFLSKTFIGPSGNFDSITCGEFEVTEVEFTKFISEPDHLCLANIAAVLWRPKDIPFMRYVAKSNSYTTYNWRKKSKAFAELSAEMLYSIFTWYSGCRQMLALLFPLVYASGLEDTKSTPAENPDRDLLAFTKCIHSGAGVKNGSRSDIRTTLIKEFFFDMQHEAEKALEMERELKKHS